MLATLSELLDKRGSLSEFEMKYFISEFFFSLSYLKSKGYLMAKLSIDDFNIDLSVKINFGFPFWITEIEKLKATLKIMKSNYIGRYVGCPSDDPERVVLWEMGLLMYHMMEGRPLITNQF